MGPLDGVRVIEIASLAPAPFGCMILSDLGADVLRVERPESCRPDAPEPVDPLTRGRRSIGLNLKDPAGVDLLLRLAETADVLVEGFRPGVAERLGFGPPACAERNPGLIFARMTGWGQDGPLAPTAGHDIDYIAISGTLHPIGRAGERPVPPLNLVGDFGGGGMLLAVGILAALVERQRSGLGQVVDAAMVDGSALLSSFIYGLRARGAWRDERGVNLLDGGAPFYDTYTAADGKYVAVGALEPQFYAALLRGLGLDPADLPAQLDVTGWPVLRERFAAVFGTKTRDEWAAAFEGTDACVSPVLSPAEAAGHPHNAARGVFAEIGGVLQPSPAPRFDRTPAGRPGQARPAGHRHRRCACRARAESGPDRRAARCRSGRLRLVRPGRAEGGAERVVSRADGGSTPGLSSGWRRGDWRRGPDAEILRLAIPAFGALVAEPLFLLADAAIVGRLGTAPLGSLGVASQALTSLVNISIFLAYGTTAAVARQLGAGDRRAAIRQGVDGIWLAAAIGVVVLAVGLPLAAPITAAFGATPAVAAGAATYLRISLLGGPAMLAVLAGTGVLRGLQDTRTPLAVAVGGNVINVALNATFVLGLHWGIAGSAWGTVIAQNLAAAAYLTMVCRGARREGVSLGLDLAGLRAAARTGAALVVRTLALQAVLIAATAIAARQGDAAIAAHQVAFRLWSLLAFALDAIAIAGQAITGKYLGAGDIAGARAATRRMIRWGAGGGAVFGLVLLAGPPLLPGLFAAAPPVRSLLLVVLIVVAVQQPVAGVVFVLDGVLIGAGDQNYLAVVGLASTAVFGVAAAADLAAGGGLLGLWLAISAWLAARFITLTLRARGSAWLVTGAVRR